VNHINNDIDHILLRRSQNTLIVVGSGTILFSVWTVVKTLGVLFLLKDESVAVVKKAIDETGIILSDQQVFCIVLVIMLVIMLLFLAVRTFIGLSAISEGRGFRMRKGYLILAVIMIILSTAAAAINFFSARSQEYFVAFSNNDSLPAHIIELTSMIMLVELVFSAIRIRRVRKRVSHNAAQKQQE
jgi:hypothetical protein